MYAKLLMTPAFNKREVGISIWSQSFYSLAIYSFVYSYIKCI